MNAGRAVSRNCATIALAVAAASLPVMAWSETYPGKPIRLIVNASAGGGADVVARLVAEKLAATLGQPVIVENKPGAGGNIGADYVARAAADGYTLLAANSSFASNLTLYRKLPFHPVRDFSPVSLLVANYFYLCVPAASPLKSFQELVAKGRKDELTYASAGAGQGSHLGMELLKDLAGFKAVHVPYGGMAPAAVSLLSGNVDMSLLTPASALPQAETGKLRLLGVTAPRRQSSLPGVPAIAEFGLPGFEVNNWQGLLAPAGTPPAIVARLNQAVDQALKMPDLNARLAEMNTEARGSTPEEFKAFLAAEIDKWREVIKRTNTQID